MPLVRPPPLANSTTVAASESNSDFPALQPCPRANFESGHNDWLQITSPQRFPDFDLCPDCYNTAFRNTRYASCITPGPSKPDGGPVACDFAQPWNRLAYHWLYATQQPNLNLMGEMARLRLDEDGACPNFNPSDAEVQNGGKPVVTRSWYSVRDPHTNTPLDEVTACSNCVARVYLLFPYLDGIFMSVANGEKLPATCDLITLGKWQLRSAHTVEVIFYTASQKLETGTLDIKPLITHVKKWGLVPLCEKGATVTNQKRFCLRNNQVPEFTACEECYLKHIEPIIPQHNDILADVQAEVTNPPSGFTCDLYSHKLQQYFTDAITTKDFIGWRQKIIARNNKMQELNMQLERMKREHRQLSVQSEAQMSQMRIATMRATTARTSWVTTGWIAPPVR